MAETIAALHYLDASAPHHFVWRQRLHLDAVEHDRSLGYFAAPVKLTCADHNGHGGMSLVEWDGGKWNTTVPSIQSIKDKVLPLINSTAEEYVKANAGWPKRTEPCDKSS